MRSTESTVKNLGTVQAQLEYNLLVAGGARAVVDIQEVAEGHAASLRAAGVDPEPLLQMAATGRVR